LSTSPRTLPRLPVLLLLLSGSLMAQSGSPWPFGVTGRISLSAKDAWNLGILGAKARDADAKPGVQTAGRRVVFRGRQENGGDAGPTRLRVDILFPGGPAEKAGLELGDVIVGVRGGPAFAKGSLAPLAKALTKAESSKGRITLIVERNGKRLELVVKLGKKNRDIAKPTSIKGRRIVLDRALRWLAEQQVQDGGFPETLSARNGAIVQACLAGLAWMSGGSSLRTGRYRDNIDRAAKFVMRYVSEPERFPGGSAGGPSWDQTNWGHVHAAIFLAELEARSNSGIVRRELTRICDIIAKRMEKSGGYAHGPGGPNALGYLELNIMTGLALSGLGCARKAGIKLDLNVAKKVMAYLETSGSADGGVAYSGKPGQKGQGNIGRTAAAWLGARNLGLGRTKWGQKMGSYVASHSDDVLNGHASLMQHILLAGVAAQAAGTTATSKFWEKMRRDLVLARAPDGSLQPRPWHESLAMGSNSDVSFGQVWTTAAWAIVLGCDPKTTSKGGLPVWLGRTKPRGRR